MYSRSTRRSPRGSARRPRPIRLQCDPLEDRLPPGDVAFGGALMLSMLGPDFAPFGLGALASESAGILDAPVALRLAQSGHVPGQGFSGSNLNSALVDFSPESSQSPSGTARSTNDARSVDAVFGGLASQNADPFLSAFSGARKMRARGTLGDTNHHAGAAAAGTAAFSSGPSASRAGGAATAAALGAKSRSDPLPSSPSLGLIPGSPAYKGPPGLLGPGPGVTVGPNVPTNNRELCVGGRGKIQSETAITVSGNAVVVAYNDSRGAVCPNQKPGYQSVGWSYSLDGGQTFTDGGPIPVPGRTDIDDGDPWLVTGPDGTIYLSGIWRSLTGLAVVRGTVTDTGIDWAGPTIITGAGAYDKEAMGMDANSGTLYLTYTRFGGPGGIWLYRSDDGGQSFDGPFAVRSGGGGQGSVPVVGPNGEVYVSWNSGSGTIVFAKSLDGGHTFGPPVAAGPVNSFGIPGQDRSSDFPHMAVDLSGGDSTGNIYITYQSRINNVSRAVMVRSTDGGDTWDPPLGINDDGISTNLSWWPTVSVDDSGFVNTFFYDRRENPGTQVTNLFFAQSTDGGQSFGPNVKVSEVPFTIAQVGGEPYTTSGDYINSVSVGTDSMVAYADYRNGDPDVFFIDVSNNQK